MLGKSWFRLVLFSHYSAHIMCSQFEFEAELMKGFFKVETWLMKRVSLKWKLDWWSNYLLTRS